MLERDDQDLAIEQLPPAGARTIASSCSPSNTRANRYRSRRRCALNPPRHAVGTSRLRELGERLEQLTAQRAALPSSQLSQLDAAQARALELTERRGELSAAWRACRRRSAACSAANATSTSSTAPDSPPRSTPPTTRSRAPAKPKPGCVNSSATPSRSAPSSTASTARSANSPTSATGYSTSSPTANSKPRRVGEDAARRATRRLARDDWDTAVRRVARYRIEYEITDQADPLGPEPHDHHQAGAVAARARDRRARRATPRPRTHPRTRPRPRHRI